MAQSQKPIKMKFLPESTGMCSCFIHVLYVPLSLIFLGTKCLESRNIC